MSLASKNHPLNIQKKLKKNCWLQLTSSRFFVSASKILVVLKVFAEFIRKQVIWIPGNLNIDAKSSKPTRNQYLSDDDLLQKNPQCHVCLFLLFLLFISSKFGCFFFSRSKSGLCKLAVHFEMKETSRNALGLPMTRVFSASINLSTIR